MDKSVNQAAASTAENFKRSEDFKVSFHRAELMTDIVSLLDSDDEIVSIFFGDDDTDCGILTTDGNYVMFKTDDVRAIGRIARGIKCIKLNDGAYVQCARAIPKNTKSIMSVTKKGLAKRTAFEEFGFTNKNTKGNKIQSLTTDDQVISFQPLNDGDEVIVTSNVSQIRLTLNDIPLLSRKVLKQLNSNRLNKW